MVLKNVDYVKAGSLTDEQKEELDLDESVSDDNLIAIESHNSDYNLKGVIIRRGVSNYILNGD